MAYNLTHVGDVIARSMLGYMAVSLVVLGVQLFMCVYGLTVFLETPRLARRGRLPYLGISFLLFILLSISALMDLNFLFRLLFNSTSAENFIYLRQNTNDWLGFASQCLNNVVCFIGDGLLLYRCYIIWCDRRWVIAVPAMAYITSLVLGILSLLPMLDDISKGDTNLTYMSLYIILSVIVNLLVTILISTRLLLARRKLAALFADSKGAGQYTGVIAILIESAIPISVFGLGYAIILGVTHNGDPDLLQKEVANYVFSSLYFSFAALSPQMIIFRVTTGRSWVGDFNKATSGAGTTSNNIMFAHTHGGDSYDISANERSGQSEPSTVKTRISEKV